MLRAANEELLQRDINTNTAKHQLNAALDTSKQLKLAAEERATKLQSEKNDLIQETKKLSGRISEVRATNEQALRQANLEKLGLMGELARSKERIEKLEFEKKQLVIQENIFKEVHRTKEQKVASLEANNAFFQSQLNMFQTSNTALVEKVEALQAELDENVAALKAQNDELVDKVDTLEAELVEKDTTLKAQIIRSQTTNAELDEKVASLETQLTSSQATNAELVDKVEALETELAEKDASLDDEATVSLHDFVVEPVGGSSDNPILLDDSEVENEDIDSEHSIQANRNSKPRKRALRELNQLTAAHNHSPKRTRTREDRFFYARETSASARNISTRRRGGILL
jgi:chromosome segregation ATPase